VQRVRTARASLQEKPTLSQARLAHQKEQFSVNNPQSHRPTLWRVAKSSVPESISAVAHSSRRLAEEIA